MRRNLIYTLLAVAVLVLTIVPIGTAVFVLGFMYGDSPCIMCWEQRIGMAIIALIGLFILRYGPRPKYIGLSVLVGAWGLFMGLRHVGMHAARDVGQGFSIGILGVHTYTWALFIYGVCIVTMGVLLMLHEGAGDGVRAAAAAGARVGRRRRLPGGDRGQCGPGLREHRTAAVRRAERSHPLLVQSPALGVVARRVLDRAGVAARAMGQRAARRERGQRRPRIRAACRNCPCSR